jgi:hypothetical protein
MEWNQWNILRKSWQSRGAEAVHHGALTDRVGPDRWTLWWRAQTDVVDVVRKAETGANAQTRLAQILYPGSLSRKDPLAAARWACEAALQDTSRVSFSLETRRRTQTSTRLREWRRRAAGVNRLTCCGWNSVAYTLRFLDANMPTQLRRPSPTASSGA